MGVLNLNRKELKQNAKKNLKLNYFKSIIVMFIFTVVISGGYSFTSVIVNKDYIQNYLEEQNYVGIFNLISSQSTANSIDSSASSADSDSGVRIKQESMPNSTSNSDIINQLFDAFNDINNFDEMIDKEKEGKARGYLAPIVDRFTQKQSVFIKLRNSLYLIFYKQDFYRGINSLIAAILGLLFYFFVKTILQIGKNRFFLESRLYHGTEPETILFPYKTKKKLNMSIILIFRSLYNILWGFTIIGAFIKYYEYLMIPYVLAENPNITRKQAFKLSKELMKGNKWKTFVIDCSMIGWKLLSIGTFGISDMLYADCYYEFIYAELYTKIRKEKFNDLTYKDYLNDNALYEAEEEIKYYPEDEYKFAIKKRYIIKEDQEHYSVRNLILFFFTFAIIGWLWEVGLFLVNEGRFVNRGTMFGPWLPIYGFGGLLMLLLLKPFRKKPLRFFTVAMVLAGVLEYTTAWALETFLHEKWWDYTGYFLNIDGRICLEGLIIFALAGAAMTYFVAPALNQLYLKIKPKIALSVATILLFLFGSDFVYSSQHPNVGEGITSVKDLPDSDKVE